MARHMRIGLLWGSLGLISGCLAPAVTPTPAVSYRQDVLPVLVEHCRRCHKTGTPGSTQVTLFDAWDNARYEAIKTNMPTLIGAIRSGRMPLGQPGIVPEEQIKKLEAWVSAGSPEN